MSDREVARKWLRAEKRRLRAEGRKPAVSDPERLSRIVRILWPRKTEEKP